MTVVHHPSRRRAVQALAGLCVGGVSLCWAQPSKAAKATHAVTVAQIVDTSTSQIDVSKDFLVGSRAAWQEINGRGGLQGAAVRHLVIEVDGTLASLQSAVETLKTDTHCVALFGSVGDRAASQLVAILGREIPELPHAAPWLQNVEAVTSPSTFAIFASRQEQIAHAIKSLSVMGMTQIGAVYGSAVEYAAYQSELEQIAKTLKLAIISYKPTADLQDLAKSLTPSSPRVLLFVGGTPELVQFSQGVEKQAAQRFIIAMSDVNLQSIQQLGMSRYTPMIATQVVPMVNSSVPMVKTFRATLSRLYDEPPSPLSLAGYVAARYTHEVLQTIEGAVTRASALQAFSRRSAIDLGGYRISPEVHSRGTAYVTQSMITIDGRLLG